MTKPGLPVVVRLLGEPDGPSPTPVPRRPRHRSCPAGHVWTPEPGTDRCPTCHVGNVRQPSGVSRPQLSKMAWQRKRQWIRVRDGHRCVSCGLSERLSVHHLIKARDGGTDDDTNLVTLCSRCHAQADRDPGFLERPRYTLNQFSSKKSRA